MSTQPTLRIQKPARPLAAACLIVSSLFLLLSLVSYSRTDPSWNVALTSIEDIQNLGGIVGSWISDMLLQGFGLVAYIVTLVALTAGISFFRSRTFLLTDSNQSTKQPRWLFPLGVGIFMISLSALLSTIPLQLYSTIPMGGILGYWFSKAGAFCFSNVGATVIFVGGLWTSWILMAPSLPIKLKIPSIPLRAWFGKLKSLRTKTEPKIDQKKSQTLPAISKGVEKQTEPKSEGPLLQLFKRPEQQASAEKNHSDRVLLVNKAPEKKKESKNTNANFELPSLQFLDLNVEKHFEISREELIANSRALEQKLLDFGVQGQVTNIHPGPIITLYEFEPAAGVKVKNILNLTDDLKLALRALSIRIIAPIPGRAAVGIEIPNPRRQTVCLREILESVHFQNSPSKLTLAMGKTTGGDSYCADLAKMPHLLIAGATGSGKSVGLNAMVVSLLYKATPEELKIIMIDPKMLELSVYEGIPHLLLPVVTDPKKAARALAWAVKEMERRYRLISSLGARNLKSYNEKVERLTQEELKRELEIAAKTEEVTSAIMDESENPDGENNKETRKQILEDAGLDHYVKLPFIVIVIDELADLIMVAARDVEESIARLAQMARAAGIHLIIATQRPSVDVITGVIKANLPTRCAFQVASKVDSRTIIDTNGAENLIGEGDMLFLPPGTSRLERLHGPFISEDEIAKIVRFLKGQGSADYNIAINLEESPTNSENSAETDDFDDQLYDQALQVVFETKSPSASMLQRRLRVGYNRAARMIERMEAEGIVSAPLAGGKGREILITPST